MEQKVKEENDELKKLGKQKALIMREKQTI
jgi:hypothetical protein